MKMKKLFIAMSLLLSGFAGYNVSAKPIEIDNALTSEEKAAARLTPEVMWKMGRVGEHALSPDGKSVLYTLTRYNMAENRGVTIIVSRNRHLVALTLARLECRRQAYLVCIEPQWRDAVVAHGS